MNRGIDRRKIFHDTHDRQHFLELLGETVRRYRFRVHAWCLMDNHYHVIIQTPDANLSQGMQWLGVSYSAWFNARHQRIGPLFQGRFKSVPVEQGAWALELSLYVHLNPINTYLFGRSRGRRSVEAGGWKEPTRSQVTARLKALREYRWSSYRSYAGYEKGPDWLTTEELLSRCSRKAAERHAAYRELVREIVGNGVEESRLEQFRGVPAVGSNDFVQKMRKLATGVSRETSGRGRLRARVSFEDVVCAVEEARGESRAAWLERHGDRGKWLVLWQARQFTGMTLQELGDEMGGMDYAAVSAGLRRFSKTLPKQRKVRKWLKVTEQILNVET